MNGNFDVVVYRKRAVAYKRTETDLVKIILDAKHYSPSRNSIQISAGEFKIGKSTTTKYSYFENQQITVFENDKKIFEGTFEQLCDKLRQNS